MPIQLILFLLAILGGFLYLTLLNITPVPINIYPDITINLPVSLPLFAAFSGGVVTVMLLYFYDTFIETVNKARKSALDKRARRVVELYDTGAEQLRLNNSGQAEKYFKKALAHDQSHLPSIIGLGVIRRMDGVVSEAIKLHSKARGIDKNSVTALMELGEDYIAAEQFTNAVSVFQEAIGLVGRSLPPHIRVRDILLKTRNFNEAIIAQKRIVSIAPRGQAQKERAMLTALIYEEALDKLAEGRFYDAKDGFKSVLRNDGQFIPAYLKLAEVYERIGSTKNSIKTLEKGFKATRSILILKALEMFLSARGEMDKVVDNYKWAKSLESNNEVIRLLLADAYVNVSNFASARAEIDSLNGSLVHTTLYHLIEGKIQHGENNIDQALDSYAKAREKEAASCLSFTCMACGGGSHEFSGRCKACGQWNTLQAVLS
ncbi:hypothetical protein MNBD_NITROSPINAE04-925 [hydrothermal vent metagenome]|uniref:LapB rubredoxin metal binding domain-containing protein n=1 Tax=hydrothermal vent metagenome TaxID=652676 RepID=A0A3B1BY38_9ZZZZ